MLKDLLRYSAYGVLAALITGPAFAQSTSSTSTGAPAAAGPSSSADAGAALGEIVVTAQRFDQTLQKTPLIISAVDAKKLVGVTDIRQIQTVTPGVQLGNSGNITQTYVRGVGSLNATSAQESSVAYNVDGVFLFTSTMINPLMYDLQRIEILKGPQGTLYGRNASGGAVNLITRGASLGGVEGYVEGEYGNYDQKRLVGAVNLPLSQTLAIRLAGQHIDHDGYLSDGTDDQGQTSGRLRVLWEPSGSVTLHAGVDGSVADSKGAGTSIEPNPTNVKFLGGLDPRAQTGPVFLGGTSLLSSAPNPAPFFKDHQWSAFTQLDVDLGFANLTVLPAYRHENLDYRDYVPGYEDRQSYITRQKSLEVRLANKTDRLRWVAGAYYFKENQKGRVQIRNESNFQNADVRNPTFVESWALFGEGTYSLLDNFRIIGGLRYSEERVGSGGEANALLGPPGIINPITGAQNVQTAAFNPFNPVTNPTGELLDYFIDGRAKDNALTWKGGLELDLTPESLLFATASRGFKGGGVYVDIPQAPSSFRPEFLTAYELGSRNRFFHDSLQLNAEIFYWKLRDQQIPFVGFDPIGQVTFITANAGSGHMSGANVDATWKATADDTFHVGVEYLHSKYSSFSLLVPSQTVLPSTHCALSNYAGPRSLAPVAVDCSGQPLLRAPKWSGSASYEHRFRLQNDGDITFSADTVFASPRFLDPGYTTTFRQKTSAIVNTSLTYNAPHDAFSVIGWVRNLGNARIMTGGNQLVDFYARPTLLPPRTYGVTVRYNF